VRAELIVFSGLPGTGKSTLADALGLALGLPVYAVDPVESAILRAGIAAGFVTGLAAYLVVETLAEARLAAGLSAIVDAVNAEEPGKDMWRALAARLGVPLRVVECRLPDEAVHRARLLTRQRGLAIPEPTWDDVLRRRAAFTAWREPSLVIDTGEPLAANLARLRDYLG
jgi:predicted kinase